MVLGKLPVHRVLGPRALWVGKYGSWHGWIHA